MNNVPPYQPPPPNQPAGFQQPYPQANPTHYPPQGQHVVLTQPMLVQYFDHLPTQTVWYLNFNSAESICFFFNLVNLAPIAIALL